MVLRRILNVLFASGLALAGFASAQADSLRELALVVPNKLVSEGISRVGDLDLRKFLGESRKVEVTQFLGDFPIGSTGKRQGMVNFPSRREVVYSALALSQASPEVRQVWVLHEFLEAVGYDDEQYALSVALWWLSLQTALERRSLVESSFYGIFSGLEVRHEDRVYILAGGGGGTGVGGGGDRFSIAFKMRLMKTAQGDAIGLSRLHWRILTLNIETEYDQNKKHPGMVPVVKRRFEGEWSVSLPVAVGIVDVLAARGAMSVIEELSR